MQRLTSFLIWMLADFSQSILCILWRKKYYLPDQKDVCLYIHSCWEISENRMLEMCFLERFWPNKRNHSVKVTSFYFNRNRNWVQHLLLLDLIKHEYSQHSIIIRPSIKKECDEERTYVDAANGVSASRKLLQRNSFRRRSNRESSMETLKSIERRVPAVLAVLDVFVLSFTWDLNSCERSSDSVFATPFPLRKCSFNSLPVPPGQPIPFPNWMRNNMHILGAPILVSNENFISAWRRRISSSALAGLHPINARTSGNPVSSWLMAISSKRTVTFSIFSSNSACSRAAMLSGRAQTGLTVCVRYSGVTAIEGINGNDY